MTGRCCRECNGYSDGVCTVFSFHVDGDEHWCHFSGGRSPGDRGVFGPREES